MLVEEQGGEHLSYEFHRRRGEEEYRECFKFFMIGAALTMLVLISTLSESTCDDGM